MMQVANITYQIEACAAVAYPHGNIYAQTAYGVALLPGARSNKSVIILRESAGESVFARATVRLSERWRRCSPEDNLSTADNGSAMIAAARKKTTFFNIALYILCVCSIYLPARPLPRPRGCGGIQARWQSALPCNARGLWNTPRQSKNIFS